MSSGDELGNFSPVVPKKSAVPPKTSGGTANGRIVAGPSSKPAPAARKNSRKVQEPQETHTDEEEAEVVIVDNEEGPTEPREVQTKTRSKAAQSRVDSATKARAVPSKAKGKAKAVPPTRPSPITGPDEPMEVDEIQIVGEATPVHPPEKRAQSDAKNMKLSGSKRQEDALKREIDRLRKQLDNVNSHRTTLTQQLEELFQIRNTEPEQALEQQAAHYEARLKTQETLIQEQSSQLSRLKALPGSSNSYMVHFLSREAVDEEKKVLEKEMARWKDTVNQKESRLAEKDKQIAELEAQTKVLQADLKAEIERAKSLTYRNPPPSVTRNGLKSAVEDPKHSAVVKLYEDLTNFLVVNVKFEKSEFLGLDETVYSCLYTHQAEDGDMGDSNPSLNFTLRAVWQRADGMDPEAPVTSQDQLQQKIQYQPLQLEMESPEFVQRLDFFKDPFLFSSDQLHVFRKTLADRVSGALAEPEEEEEEEEEEVHGD